MTTAVSRLAQYCDLKTVHARTAVPMSTLREWIREGKLPAFRLPGRQIRVRESDVQALFTPVTPKHQSNEGIPA